MRAKEPGENLRESREIITEVIHVFKRYIKMGDERGERDTLMELFHSWEREISRNNKKNTKKDSEERYLGGCKLIVAFCRDGQNEQGTGHGGGVREMLRFSTESNLQ